MQILRIPHRTSENCLLSLSLNLSLSLSVFLSLKMSTAETPTRNWLRSRVLARWRNAPLDDELTVVPNSFPSNYFQGCNFIIISHQNIKVIRLLICKNGVILAICVFRLPNVIEEVNINCWPKERVVRLTTKTHLLFGSGTLFPFLVHSESEIEKRILRSNGFPLIFL